MPPKARRRPAKVLKDEQGRVRLAPSEYVRLSSLDTDAYLDQVDHMRIPRIIELLDVTQASQYKDTGLSIDQPLFQPFPSDVRFQQFVPTRVYELPLQLHNVDSVARRIRVLDANSQYFQVVPPPNAADKVAPGVSLTFVVRFFPDEARDYGEEIVCVTEREKFVIPVRAVGARAVFDLPDSVAAPKCIVKGHTSKAVLVRNVGTRAGSVRCTGSSGFDVSPSTLSLSPQEMGQLTVTFRPHALGAHVGELRLDYDTGEQCVVALSGESETANIRLDRTSLSFEPTSISMTSQRTIKLLNRSGHMAHFSWRALSDEAEEDSVRQSLFATLRGEADEEEDAFSVLLDADASMRANMTVLARQQRQQQEDVLADPQLYEDDIFSIDPLEGDVWPNSVRAVHALHLMLLPCWLDDMILFLSSFFSFLHDFFCFRQQFVYLFFFCCPCLYINT